MPSLVDHQSNEYTKLLLEGDSGSGKTGSLVSLVSLGYKLRILDMDNGLEPLKQFILKECPDRIADVEFRTIRDKRKSNASGPILDGSPKAFVEALKMMDNWKYKHDGQEVDLGPPTSWGPGCILVVDSLTFLSDAAYDWADALNPGAKDKRQIFFQAQNAIENVLALLTSESYRTNVIVISHIRYVDRPEGGQKGYPTAVGSALSPVIPRYFNTVALCQTSPGGKRTIQTEATPMIDLKNPKPFEMKPKYDLSDGLAQVFGVLRGKPEMKTQPKQIQLKTGTR